jgi:coiled-coil and C2 domain-containing protein 1
MSEQVRSVEQAAHDDGNTSKARYIGRIMKQYESAIKFLTAGKPTSVDELPTLQTDFDKICSSIVH